MAAVQGDAGILGPVSGGNHKRLGPQEVLAALSRMSALM
jgi:hypothetical protein